MHLPSRRKCHTTRCPEKISAQLGNVVVTTAEDLLQKFIFHAITIDKQFTIKHLSKDCEQNLEIHQFIIKQSIKNCFKLLTAYNLYSIAFPAIGAGVANIPYEKVAQFMSLVVFLSSANSNASHNVAKEISLSDEYRKTIIPIRLDNSPYAPHIDYDLNSIDSIDYYKDEEAALDKIKKTIQGKLVMAQLVTNL